MDQELKAYLEGMEARMGERFERVETEVRHTRVLVESVDSNVRLVAEGVMGVTERLEKFQRETALNFEEVKASIAPYYRDLNSRVRVLEANADRKGEDVLESLRKKLGKPQA